MLNSSNDSRRPHSSSSARRPRTTDLDYVDATPWKTNLDYGDTMALNSNNDSVQGRGGSISDMPPPPPPKGPRFSGLSTEPKAGSSESAPVASSKGFLTVRKVIVAGNYLEIEYKMAKREYQKWFRMHRPLLFTERLGLQPGAIIRSIILEPALNPRAKDELGVKFVPTVDGIIVLKYRYSIIVNSWITHVDAVPLRTHSGNGLTRIPRDQSHLYVAVGDGRAFLTKHESQHRTALRALDFSHSEVCSFLNEGYSYVNVVDSHRVDYTDGVRHVGYLDDESVEEFRRVRAACVTDWRSLNSSGNRRVNGNNASTNSAVPSFNSLLHQELLSSSEFGQDRSQPPQSLTGQRQLTTPATSAAAAPATLGSLKTPTNTTTHQGNNSQKDTIVRDAPSTVASGNGGVMSQGAVGGSIRPRQARVTKPNGPHRSDRNRGPRDVEGLAVDSRRQAREEKGGRQGFARNRNEGTWDNSQRDSLAQRYYSSHYIASGRYTEYRGDHSRPGCGFLPNLYDTRHHPCGHRSSRNETPRPRSARSRSPRRDSENRGERETRDRRS